MSRRAVLDASAAVRVVLCLEEADRIAEILESVSVVLAPGIFAAEVANSLWTYVRAGRLSRERAQQALEEALSLVDDVVDDRRLVAEALGEAEDRDHPVYDLLYLLVARRNACPVVTLDGPLRELSERMGVRTSSPPPPSRSGRAR